jgi:hypothetical protein
MCEKAFQVIAVVMIPVVGVGRGYLVRDTVGSGHSAHRDRHVPRLGTVIDLGKDVGMDVNHENVARAMLPI